VDGVEIHFGGSEPVRSTGSLAALVAARTRAERQEGNDRGDAERLPVRGILRRV
jgi:hypothetical protein